MSEQRLDHDLMAIEAGLASLQLRPPRLDRDRVMYLAGQASVRIPAPRGSAPGWLWPCLAAASLLLAVAMGGLLLRRGEFPPGEPVAHGQRTPTDQHPPDSDRSVHAIADLGEPPAGPPRAEYLELRRLVLTQGAEAIPELPRATGPGGDIPTPGDAYGRRVEQPHPG